MTIIIKTIANITLEVLLPNNLSLIFRVKDLVPSSKAAPVIPVLLTCAVLFSISQVLVLNLSNSVPQLFKSLHSEAILCPSTHSLQTHSHFSSQVPAIALTSSEAQDSVVAGLGFAHALINFLHSLVLVIFSE